MRIALLALFAATLAQAQPAGYGWFAELAGACWRGETLDGKTADTQCYELQYGKVVRGTIRVANFEGEAVFAADPARNRVLFTQWAVNGTYATGEMTFAGEDLVFVTQPADGSPAQSRNTWHRIDADAFRVVRERREGDGWKESLRVVYRRLR